MHSLWPLFHVICLYFGSSLTTSDLFTSSQDLQEVLGNEALAFEDASYVLLLEMVRLNEEKQRHKRKMAAASHTDHDVLGKFLSTSRFGALWRVVFEQRSNRNIASVRTALKSPPYRHWWPTDRDVSGAAVGICRLQQVYDIPATRMGSFASRLVTATSPYVLVDIARGCFVKGEFGNTSAWLQAAVFTAKSHSCTNRKLFLGASWLEANDKRLRALKKRGRQPRHPESPPNDVHEYKAVCVSKGHLRPALKNLVCRRSTNSSHPLLMLQPLVLEVLALKPRIVLFRDFLSRSEVKFIRHKSLRALKRGTIYVSDESPHGVSWKRTSKVAWLWDSDHDVLQRITGRIAAATGLSLESAEAYQVANYGLGGHYTPHVDSMDFDQVAHELEKSVGNRLATMLLFLSDVPAGGATGFVELGLAVKPRSGDALFWFDVEPYEGKSFPRQFSFWHQKKAPDQKTKHVGCPVLLGSKWISTKWIRENGNVVVNYDFPA